MVQKKKRPLQAIAVHHNHPPQTVCCAGNLSEEISVSRIQGENLLSQSTTSAHNLRIYLQTSS